MWAIIVTPSSFVAVFEVETIRGPKIHRPTALDLELGPEGVISPGRNATATKGR